MTTATTFAATSSFALNLAENAAKKVAAGGGIKKLSEKKSDAFAVNPFAIYVQPDFNCRDFSDAENVEHLANIKASIKARGFDRSKPVEVFLGKDGRFYLVDGETRLRAVIGLINEGVEIKAIPVIISEGKNDAERLAAQFTSNMGKNFNEIESARGVAKLVSYGWDDAKIAERTALSPAKVARLKAVLALPEAIVGMVRDKTVSVTFALDTFKAAKSEEEAIETLKAGVVEAKAKGRNKVMKKDVNRLGLGVPTFKTRLVDAAEVIKAAEVETGSGTVALHLSPELYERLVKALGL